MKILIANPPYRISINKNQEKYFIRAGSRWPFSVVKNKNKKAEYMPFPFYLAYTAALLQKNNFEVYLEDSIAENQTQKQFLKKVVTIKPDILLFETSTNSIKYDIALAQKIKKINPKIIICMAGFHVTSLTKQTFKISKNAIDFILLQEYEFNFLNLVKHLEQKKDFSKLKGIAFKKGKIIVKNDSLKLTDVNKLPFPAWNLFPSLNYYWDGFCQLKPAIQMHASRGCPFKCNFCAWNQIMYKNGEYRPRNAQNICDEIEFVIKKYKIKEIYFDDDTFTGDKKHVLDFCNEILKRGLNKKVNWSAMADFMITDPKMISKMKESGCIGLKFGVESGNPEILKNIGKPINFNRLQENLNLCSKLHIKTHGTFTFGLSGETKKTLNDTLDLAKKLDCDSVQFSITTPFPGTKYYQNLEKQNRLISKNWKNFDGNSQTVIKFDDFNSQYLLDFYQTATKKWLKSKIIKPKWLFRQFFYFSRSLKNQGLATLPQKTKRLFEIFNNL